MMDGLACQNHDIIGIYIRGPCHPLCISLFRVRVVSLGRSHIYKCPKGASNAQIIFAFLVAKLRNKVILLSVYTHTD